MLEVQAHLYGKGVMDEGDEQLFLHFLFHRNMAYREFVANAVLRHAGIDLPSYN